MENIFLEGRLTSWRTIFNYIPKSPKLNFQKYIPQAKVLNLPPIAKRRTGRGWEAQNRPCLKINRFHRSQRGGGLSPHKLWLSLFWPTCISGYIDSLGRYIFVKWREKRADFFLTPPLEKYIMMYIKLLVLVGFDLNFPLIFGINKLYQIKASFPTFQLSPCFTSFIIVIKFTLTTFF